MEHLFCSGKEWKNVFFWSGRKSMCFAFFGQSSTLKMQVGFTVTAFLASHFCSCTYIFCIIVDIRFGCQEELIKAKHTAIRFWLSSFQKYCFTHYSSLGTHAHNHECFPLYPTDMLSANAFSSCVEKRIHECRSVPQTIVHTPPCWNGLEVLFMLSQSSARNSKQNPGRHELR